MNKSVVRTKMKIEMEGDFSLIVGEVKQSLKDCGLGVLSEIDVQATLYEKTGVEIEPYTILGVCNPALALRAIRAEHEIGIFMPCNVLIHKCAGKVHVVAQDPLLMVELTKNEALRPIALEAVGHLADALDRVSRLNEDTPM